MELIEKLKFVFNENDVEVLEFTEEKKTIIYKCNKCGKEYQYSSARTLFARISLCKDCYEPFKRWNAERLEERLRKLYTNSDIKVIKFLSLRKGGEIICNKCNTIEKINNFESLMSGRKDCFCNNCEKDGDTTYTHLQEELKKGYLKLIKWNGVNEKSKFKCLRCGHIFEKGVSKRFDGKLCPNCFKVSNKFSFTDAQKKLDEKGNFEYQLLQHKGFNYKSLIKHKCGFIYSTCLSDFEKTRGCPKCYGKTSKGEQLVIKFLEKYNYTFIPQKRFEDLKRFSFDFYLEINNKMILLEVQGRQHYEDIEIFDSLEDQKRRDKIKKDYCLANNISLIEIPYWELKNLEQFLQLKFNDYLEKE